MADRLISADGLKGYVNSISTHWLNEWDTVGVLAAIDKQPTIDAEPVKHGRWIWDKRFSDYTCSECHNWDLKTPNYCSNCGARMDGEY